MDRIRGEHVRVVDHALEMIGAVVGPIANAEVTAEVAVPTEARRKTLTRLYQRIKLKSQLKKRLLQLKLAVLFLRTKRRCGNEESG